MTERERWVVYPLLFLALGAALRDKFIDRTTAKSIKCQELLVVDEQPLGREILLARIGRVEPQEGSRPVGDLFVNGRIAVAGNVEVDGFVNARQYAYQGFVLAPGIHPLVPGAILPNVMRNMPQTPGSPQPKAQQRGKPADEKSKSSSAPANPPAATQKEPSSKSNAGKQ
jgi:hypothetical protein